MAASIKRIGELKQQVYRDFACGFSLCEDLADRDAPYWSMASSFSGDRPATAEAQALALLQLLKEEKVEAWLYRFGLPDLFLHAGVVALSDKGPVFCDPFTGLMFAEPITAVLDQLDRGETPKAQPLGKDRKVCVVDAEADPKTIAEVLAKRAERELVGGGGGQRAFLLNWTPELYTECSPDLRSALEVLDQAGGAPGLARLLLYPVQMTRDGKSHTKVADMPILGPWFAEGQAKGQGAGRSARAAQGMEAARVAALSKLVGELRRDLESFRGARAGPGEPSPRRGRLAGPDGPRIAELDVEVWDHQTRADRAGLSIRRLEANHARLIEEAAAEHKVTQDALRRAGADLTEARASLLGALADTDRLTFEVERLTRDRDSARAALNDERGRTEADAAELRRLAAEAEGERSRLALEVERLEQRLEQLRGSAEDATREALEGRELVGELLAQQERLEREIAALETAVASTLTDRASDARRFEEERKLLLVAQARLEREVQTVRGALNQRADEVEALARSILHLAYAPVQGQPLIAPGDGAHAEAAHRVSQRIAELEQAKAAAETELHNHRTMLANSRYMRTRAALSRLLRRGGR